MTSLFNAICAAGFFVTAFFAIPLTAEVSDQIHRVLIKPETGSSIGKAGSANSTKGSPAAGDLFESGSSPDKIAEVPSQRNDVRNQTVLTSLAQQAGWFPDIKISVLHGIVTISGKAANSEQLEWLAKTADRLPSVVAVINKTDVETPPVSDFTPAWKEFRHLIERSKKSLPLILIAMFLMGIFMMLGRYLSRGMSSVWGRYIANPFLLSTMSKISMIPIWILFFYLTLQTAGLSTLAATIIGGTGAIGIVMGFAFKDIAENYLSGILLAIRSPFTKGDDIQIGEYEGYVQSLNMRGTTIVDYDGNLVLIPNSKVIQSVIRNRTSNPSTRASYFVSIGYTDSVSKSQELIMQVLTEIPAVLKDPAPLVVATELVNSTVKLRVLFWYNCVESSLFRTKSLAIARTKEILLANGISVPDATNQVAFADALRVQLLQPSDQPPVPSDKRLTDLKQKAADNLTVDRNQPNDSAHNGAEREAERMGDRAETRNQPARSDLLKK